MDWREFPRAWFERHEDAIRGLGDHGRRVQPSQLHGAAEDRQASISGLDALRLKRGKLNRGVCRSNGEGLAGILPRSCSWGRHRRRIESERQGADCLRRPDDTIADTKGDFSKYERAFCNAQPAKPMRRGSEQPRLDPYAAASEGEHEAIHGRHIGREQDKRRSVVADDTHKVRRLEKIEEHESLPVFEHRPERAQDGVSA
jgi:hypothetical protein